MQRFLLRTQRERAAEAIGQELIATAPQKITVSGKIKKIFPSSRKIIHTVEQKPKYRHLLLVKILLMKLFLMFNRRLKS